MRTATRPAPLRVPHAASSTTARLPPLEPARDPQQRRADARLLVAHADGTQLHAPRATWYAHLAPGDVVIGNDAATLPASLFARHVPTNRAVEIRLAGHAPRAVDGALRFAALIFGAGDWRTPTEERAQPPALASDDVLACGEVTLVVEASLGHPRLVLLRFPRDDALAWSLLARAGHPVQYAHLRSALAPWDVTTPIASRPFAFEAPSAGFVLDWRSVHALRVRGIAFATLTHAAGLSSTGDEALDARLPFDEPYVIPLATAQAIARAQARQGRIVAIGTSVVRALEHAAAGTPSVHAGAGIARQRIGPSTRLSLVDALLTGTHEPATSHFELLRAFVPDETLARAHRAMAARGYRTHEFGDSMLLFRPAR